jgi:hypothetical protein
MNANAAASGSRKPDGEPPALQPLVPELDPGAGAASSPVAFPDEPVPEPPDDPDASGGGSADRPDEPDEPDEPEEPDEPDDPDDPDDPDEEPGRGPPSTLKPVMHIVRTGPSNGYCVMDPSGRLLGSQYCSAMSSCEYEIPAHAVGIAVLSIPHAPDSAALWQFARSAGVGFAGHAASEHAVVVQSERFCRALPHATLPSTSARHPPTSTVTVCGPDAEAVSGIGPHGATLASVKTHFEHVLAAPPMTALRSLSLVTPPPATAVAIARSCASVHAPICGEAGACHGSEAASIGAVGGHVGGPASESV